LEFFAARSRSERDELLRIWRELANSPSQKSEWVQRTTSGRELKVRRSSRWIVRYWVDAPVLEVKIVDVEKVVP
jgi:hypothetical protein